MRRIVEMQLILVNKLGWNISEQKNIKKAETLKKEIQAMNTMRLAVKNDKVNCLVCSTIVQGGLLQWE